MRHCQDPQVESPQPPFTVNEQSLISQDPIPVPMIVIVTAQILREIVDDPSDCNKVIDESINEIG